MHPHPSNSITRRRKRNHKISPFKTTIHVTPREAFCQTPFSSRAREKKKSIGIARRRIKLSSYAISLALSVARNFRSLVSVHGNQSVCAARRKKGRRKRRRRKGSELTRGGGPDVRSAFGFFYIRVIYIRTYRHTCGFPTFILFLFFI